MAIYIQDQILDLNTIRLQDGTWYKGVDEVKQLLSNTWREVDERFFKKGLKVVFRTPSIRSGNGKGNQGYSYPRAVSYKTRKGKVKIAWADDKKEVDGQIVYSPILKRIGVDQKTMVLDENDIEEILFMLLFNPNVVTPQRPSGRTFLEDLEAEALKYEESETNAATLSYWLFRKESPFYADDKKLNVLCLAYGINPENKSTVYKKQLLAEAVKRAERKNELEYNLKAFNNMCEKLKDGQETREIEIMALIQKAINGRAIKFDPDKMAWVLLGIDGNFIKIICRVPPQLLATNKVVLKKHLMESRDDVQVLQSAVNEEPQPSKMDRALLQAPLPEEITEEYIESTMTWPDKKAIYKFIGYEPRNATAAQINPVLVDYFITQGKTIPFEVK